MFPQNNSYVISTGLNKSLLIPFSMKIINNLELSSKQFMENEKIYYNIFNTIFVVILILQISDEEIITLYIKNSNILNVFSTNMKKIFENLYIYNSHNSKELIIKYPVLCYLIFKISKSLFDNKLWHTDYKTNKFTMEDHLEIIHTMIDIINHLVKIQDLKDVTNKINIINLDEREDVLQIFETLKLNYFNNVARVYQNNDVFNRIQKYHTQVIEYKFEKKSIVFCVVNKKYTFPLTFHKMRQKEKRYNNLSYQHICKWGNFHDWIIKGSVIKCKKCDEIWNTALNNNTMSQYNEYKIKKLKANLLRLNLNNRPSSKYIVESIQNNDIDDFNTDYSKIIKNISLKYKHVPINNYSDWIKQCEEYNVESREEYEKKIKIFINNISRISLSSSSMNTSSLFKNRYSFNYDHNGIKLKNSWKISLSDISIKDSNNEIHVYNKDYKYTFVFNKTNFRYLGYLKNKDFIEYPKNKIPRKLELFISMFDMIKYTGLSTDKVNDIIENKELDKKDENIRHNNIIKFIRRFYITLDMIINKKEKSHIVIKTDEKSKFWFDKFKHSYNLTQIKMKKSFQNLNKWTKYSSVKYIDNLVLYFIDQLDLLMKENMGYNEYIFRFIYEAYINWFVNDKKSSEGNYLYALGDVDSFVFSTAEKTDQNIGMDNNIQLKSEFDDNNTIPEDEERFVFDTENDEDDLLIPY